MKTLTARAGDMEFDVSTGIEAIAQRTEQTLLLLLGEWFLDTRRGVPYRPDMLGNVYDESLVRQRLAQEILSVDGVIRIKEATLALNRQTRVMRYDAVIETDEGVTTLTYPPT